MPAETLPDFHDAHSHAVEHQRGGFLIALEGEPRLPYMLSNQQVLAQEDRSRLLFGVPYVSHRGSDRSFDYPVVKYHARREGYSPSWVSVDLERHPRRLALIDTLNAIDWAPESYLTLARDHPQTQFLFCHAGGYDILQFVKMARFMPNVWLDFSATQEIFGWVDRQSNLRAVTDAIDHALAEPRIARKLVFGTDNPGFRQAAAVREAARRLTAPHDYLVGNFERLVATVGLV
ncbi:amidohydrolase family protein [Lutibaculum baratangense]|uniref:Amidohydrolase-related domain-containing protein n=1 Tax=Lutibaculum baratangense AMV1 TaxID=631454 RepID=V4QZP8_9HYPH|nr:amidohydrolase family protein [Lutibaculum baratangense]ESR25242.1 hypothetical protein N177_1914 [Lutibaculum baratangense AMV1]